MFHLPSHSYDNDVCIITDEEEEYEVDDSDEDDMDEDLSDAEDASDGIETASSSDDDENGSGAGNAALVAKRPAALRPLTIEARSVVTGLLLRLANKGQSSKDKSLAKTASHVLSSLAYIDPDAVLPAVQAHFDTALTTVTGENHLLFGFSYIPYITKLYILIILLLICVQPPVNWPMPFRPCPFVFVPCCWLASLPLTPQPTNL